jgi:hypothetical protein
MMKLENDNLFHLNIESFSEDITKYIWENLSERIELNDIKKYDGRYKNSPEYSKKGSYIYCLFNTDNEVIYIGETGQKLKNRLFSDGNGAHKGKAWLHEVEYVKYYKDKNMNNDTRKLIERILILNMRKKYNLYNVI